MSVTMKRSLNACFGLVAHDAIVAMVGNVVHQSSLDGCRLCVPSFANSGEPYGVIVLEVHETLENLGLPQYCPKLIELETRKDSPGVAVWLRRPSRSQRELLAGEDVLRRIIAFVRSAQDQFLRRCTISRELTSTL